MPLLHEQGPDVQSTALGILGLTVREAEVLAWITQGKTNLDIATILGFSSLTVKKHLEHIYVKLGVDTRTAAAVRARDLAG